MICIRIDNNVLKAIIAKAKKEEIKYQPLINKVLKDHFLGNKEYIKIRNIVRKELANVNGKNKKAKA